MKRMLVVAALILAGCGTAPSPSSPDDDRPPSEAASLPSSPLPPVDGEGSPPDHPVRLVFVHHSSGENWLSDDGGGLGLALAANNYLVSDTNYGWGPYEPILGGPIGDNTDIGHWWNWFLGPSRDEIMEAVYRESDQHSSYTRLEATPSGENEIVLFKSCFPNSHLGGWPDDPPTTGRNPLEGAGMGDLTVGNAKALYLGLLEYFADHPDTLFVAVTAPPLIAGDTSPEAAANARAFNAWLVEDWLDDYPLANVAVFDFYTVLTGPDNHHRYRDGQIEYVTDRGSNTSAYAVDGDSHPTTAGNVKATGEFVPLLNWFYWRWRTAAA